MWFKQMPRVQPTSPEPVFCDNSVAVKTPDDYIEVRVIVEKVLESWRDSILSFEFLNSDGGLRSDRELSPKNMQKRQEVEIRLRENKKLEKPILGIGLMDNVEIGSGRDVFMALAYHGFSTLPVHVRKKQMDEFKSYII